MPAAAPDDLPREELAPGYTTHAARWGGLTVDYDRMPTGQDVSSMLSELPDGRCQAHHWGYLLEGRASVDYGTHQETIEAGQAYYLPPGHVLTVLEDSAALEFTRTADLEVTFAAIRARKDDETS
jgi:hypothetical protein